MASNLETNGPAMLYKLIEEAIQTIQPTGEAREVLMDAFQLSGKMVEWFKVMQNNDVNVNPTWTSFIH